MGRVQRRKGNVAKNKIAHRFQKTRNYRRDLDQIWEDVQPENAEKVLTDVQAEDVPGLGKFYCISCARHFINKHAYEEHVKTKFHKRGLKRLQEKPYTIKEAEECGK